MMSLQQNVARFGEFAASETEDAAETFFSSSEDGAVVLDGSGRLMRLNNSAAQILGIPPSAVGLRSLWDERPTLRRSDLFLDFQSFLAKGARGTKERFIPDLRLWLRYGFRPVGSDILLTLRRCDEIYDERALYLDLQSRYYDALKFGRVTVWDYDNGSDRLSYSQPGDPPSGASFTTLAKFLTDLNDKDAQALLRAKQAAISDAVAFDLELSLSSGSGGAGTYRLRGGPDLGQGQVSRLRGVMIRLSGASAKPRVFDGETQRRSAGRLLRAARGALSWSVRELSERTGVSVATINRCEAGSDDVSREKSFASLQRVLSTHGVQFGHDADGRPAISLR